MHSIIIIVSHNYTESTDARSFRLSLNAYDRVSLNGTSFVYTNLLSFFFLINAKWGKIRKLRWENSWTHVE